MKAESTLKKTPLLIFSGAAYGLFLVGMALAIAFTADLPGPKGFFPDRPGDIFTAIWIDLSLIALFGLQHSVMARRPFKQVLAQLIPEASVRSLFVLLSSLLLLLVLWQWRTITFMIWQIHNPILRTTLYLGQAVGWLIVIAATFQIDHFRFLGLRQVYTHVRGRQLPASTFKAPWMYRLVRHPMMTGLLLAIWCVPDLRLDRLLFNLGFSAYILIGIHFEEQDLARELGRAYRDYQARMPKLLPMVMVRRKRR